MRTLGGSEWETKILLYALFLLNFQMHQAAQQAIRAMFPCPDDSLPHLE